MNTFFGVLEGSVAFMATTFSTILYDAVRIIDERWEHWIDAMEYGRFPEITGLGEYCSRLQVGYLTIEMLLTIHDQCSSVHVGTPEAKP